jgi:hypothetical protein
VTRRDFAYSLTARRRRLILTAPPSNSWNIRMIDAVNVLRTALALLFSSTFGAASAQDPVVRWNEVEGSRVAHRGMAAADFDDDGRTEAAIAMSGPALLVQIEGHSDGTWNREQTLLAPSNEANREIPVAWSRPGPDALIVLISDGQAVVYVGVPLAESGRFNTVVGAFAGQIGDVDADGDDELVVAALNGVGVYEVASGQLEWSGTGVTTDVELAQLDTDAALEILIGGPASRALDGATRAVEWQPANGLGDHLATGRILPDGAFGFVGGRWSNVTTVYRSSPWSAAWNYNSADVDALDTCDVEGDGRDEIVVADGTHDSIHVVDTATQADQLTFPNPEPETNDVLARDFAGTGGCQFYAAPGSTSVSNSLFRIFDASTGTVLHDRTYVSRAFTSVAVGDIDGDGREEMVLATPSDPAAVRVLDADTGVLLWELAPTSNDPNHPFRLGVRRVLLAQVDADPAMEIVLVGKASSHGRVIVIDGTTRQVQLQIGSSASEPMSSRYAIDAALVDYDGDGADDVLVGTHAYSTATSGVRLHVFGLDDGAELWQSIAIGSGFAEIEAVMALQGDTDAALELVAVLPAGLRAFDAESGLLDWTMTLPSGIRAATYNGVAGQFALARDGAVTTYDAVTRQLMHTLVAEGSVPALTSVDGPPRWIVLDEGRLAVYDAHRGERIGESEWLGPTSEFSQVVSWRVGEASRIANTTSLGHAVHDLGTLTPVFADGFEP